MVEKIGMVEQNIGVAKSLMFAYNLKKYYLILLGKFLAKLTVDNYQKKYKGKQWKLFFATPEFIIKKKEAVIKLTKARMQFEEVYVKCKCKLDEIKKLNEYFVSALSAEVEEDQEFDDNFFRSYRKSTDILYITLKGFLKDNKITEFYFYLCITCICHMFSDFYVSQ
jgi:hypothetical protein